LTTAASASREPDREPILDRLISRAVHAVAAIGILALLSQALLIVIDVLMRSLLGAPLLGVIDIYQLLNVIVIAAFIPFVVFQRRNINVTLFDGLNMPRLAAGVTWFADLCTLLFLIIATWQCMRYTSQLSGQLTPILELPVAPVWWVGCGLLFVCVPAQLAICLRRSPAPKAHEHSSYGQG